MRKTNNHTFKRIVFLVVLFIGLGAMMPVSTQAKARISKNNITIGVGETTKLKVKGAKKKVRWSSSNKAVVTVSKKGKVRARKAGSAKIIAKVGKKRLVCKVKVDLINSAAMKYLNKKFYTIGTWSGEPKATVTFKRGYLIRNELYNGSRTAQVNAIVKTSYGYFIKVNDNGTKYGYRLEIPFKGKLTFVGTWDPYSYDGYSEGSSLSTSKYN